MSSIATLPRSRGVRSYDLAAFHPTIRPTDVFICTYPKSGTTWLGYLLAQVLKRDPTESLNLKSFGKYVPDVNLLYTKGGSLAEHAGLPDPRFFLCHATYDSKFPRVVYVVRDPRDVMLSYWHYQRFLKPDYGRTLADYLQNDTHWPCDWDAHAASWLLPRRHPNLLLLRYEDLHADAAGALRSVLAFAGVAASDQQVAAAVEASHFDRMRSAEEQHGVHGKAGDERERFVRKGKIGSWQEEMGPAELEIIHERYRDVMRELGY